MSIAFADGVLAKGAKAEKKSATADAIALAALLCFITSSSY
jgi:hypothetical protein